MKLKESLVRAIKFFVLIFCFSFFNEAIAQSSEKKMPRYLKSPPSPTKARSLTKFEKEVSEIDPFIKGNLPMDAGLKSEDSVGGGFREFHPLSDRDMEDVFSSINEKSVGEEEFSQKRSSLVDRIYSQKGEVQVREESFKERLVVGNGQPREENPSLIKEVFGPEPSESEEDIGKLPGEKLAYEVGSDLDDPTSSMEEQANQQVSQQASHDQHRRPSSYEPENKFKPGMHTFFKNCILYSEPETSSEPYRVIKSGKELWLDQFNDQWHKAYKKEGPVFIQADCLN